jgi:small subunit ribosomal protein S6
VVRDYELALIVDSQQPEEAIAKTVERYTNQIGQLGGTLHKSDTWGVRKLAYPIGKHVQASYTFVQFKAEPTSVSELERSCRLDELVLRHLVVAKSELDPEPVAAPAAAVSQPEADPDKEDGDADVEGSKS